MKMDFKLLCHIFFILLIINVNVSIAQNDCPAVTKACKCIYSTLFDKIICEDIGSLNYIPQFKPSKTAFNSLTFTGNVKIQTIQASAFDGLIIDTIDLSNMGIENVDVNAFTGLSNLHTLIMDQNYITNIRNTTFDSLNELRYLSLNTNRLKNFNFKVPSSLTNLHLSNNLLENIDLAVVQNLINIQGLYLSNNKLTHIAENTFRKMAILTELDLDKNHITELKVSTFKELKDLDKLKLSSNFLTKLEVGIFSDMIYLKKLYLDDNLLVDLHEDIFLKNTALEQLYLSINKLTNVDKLFTYLTNLKYLYLQDNRISEIKPNTFTKQTMLVSLNLQGNFISTLYQDSFNGLNRIDNLILKGNLIQDLPNAFQNMVLLASLDLSFNKLKDIKDVLNSMRHIKKLWLNNNLLENVSIKSFQYLEMIYLNDNLIKTLSKNMFMDLPKLHTLELSRNNIESSQEWFLNCPMLTLYLSTNRLKNIPILPKTLNQLFLDENLLESIQDYSFEDISLRRLKLNKNRIKEISLHGFGKINNLEELYLDENEIKILPDILQSENQLTIFNVSKNLLSKLEINYLKKLHTLYADNNQIKNVDLNLEQLSSLHLANNSIETFKVSGEKLTELFLPMNPLICNQLKTLSIYNQLKTLDLSHNHLGCLDKFVFEKFPILERLQLSNIGGEIKDLNSITKLKYLDLSENNLTKFTFDKLDLDTLILDSNKITQLVLNSKVKELFLSKNQLSSDSLKELFSQPLTKLDLSFNNLETIDFNLTKSLKFLNLSNNQLKSSNNQLFDYIKDLKSLESLDFSYNRFDNLPENLFNLKFLRQIFLGSNQIEKVPKLFGIGGLSLSHLYINNNKITNIDKDCLIALSQLQELDLSGNSLTELTLPLTLELLRVFKLNSNKLTKLNGAKRFKTRIFDLSNNLFTILDTYNLQSTDGYLRLNNNLLTDTHIDIKGTYEVIDFSSNKLKSITLDSRRIKLLNLDANRFQTIPEILKANQLINELRLNNNNNLTLTDWLTISSQIESLQLRENRLTSFEYKHIQGLRSSLKSLDLRQNLLSTLNENVLNGFQMEKIYLENNKLQCDCKLAFLRALPIDKPKCDKLPTFATCFDLNNCNVNNIDKLKNIKYGYCDDIKECPAVHSNCKCEYKFNTNNLECIDLNLLKMPNFALSFTVFPQVYVKGYVKSIQTNAFINITAVTLNLNNIRLERIEARAFTGVSERLTSLILSGNRITFIDPEAFRGLSLLTYLDLKDNRIAHIDSMLFNGLTRLQIVYLNHNLINGFNDATFADMGDLQILDISNNKIESLPVNLLTNSKGLKQLQMSDNFISVIQHEFFSKLGGLEFLTINKNFLKEINGFLFNNLKLLRTLDISNNFISKFNNAFRNLTNLNKLYLSGNLMDDDLNKMEFNTGLQSLRLNDNLLTYLNNGAFKNLENLYYLQLEGNLINSLNKDTFVGLNKLLTLNLENNRLQTIPETTFDTLQKLTSLNLGSNYLMGFPSKHSLPNLITLNLNDNKIISISLQSLEKLNNLDLSNNFLTVLPKNTFNLQNLLTIELGNNLIESIDNEAFITTTKIDSLKLYNNSLKEIPSCIFKMTNLQILNLNGNRLTKLNDDSFKDLKLQEIDLGMNNINLISDRAFNGARLVKILRFNNNSISKLPSFLFSQLVKLDSLDFSYNRLTEFNSEAFLSLSELDSLNLANNPITFSEMSLKSLTALEVLDLSNTLFNFNNISYITGLSLLKTVKLNGIKSMNGLVNSNMFRGMGNLTTLEMNNCNLNKIEDGYFKELKLKFLHLNGNNFVKIENLPVSLTNLELSNNMIESINLENYVNLESLNLRYNKLTNLNVENLINLKYLKLANNFLTTSTFQNIIKLDLRELDYSYNRLDFIDYQFPPTISKLTLNGNKLQIKSLSGLEMINELHMSNCDLKTLPSFLHFKSFSSLDLSRNQLENLTLSESLQNLRIVNISYNKLKSLPFNKATLHILDVSHNQIENLSLKLRTIEEIKSQSQMDFSYNSIKQLNGYIDGRLKSLNFRKNLLKEINGLDKLNIETLDAGENLLTNFKYKGIKKVSLDGNLFTQFQFSNDFVLESLSMANNKLTSFQINLISLHTLDLRNNSLTSINENSFDLPNLKKLSIDGNPLVCDCDLSWIKTFVNYTVNPKSVVCNGDNLVFCYDFQNCSDVPENGKFCNLISTDGTSPVTTASTDELSSSRLTTTIFSSTIVTSIPDTSKSTQQITTAETTKSPTMSYHSNSGGTGSGSTSVTSTSPGQSTMQSTELKTTLISASTSTTKTLIQTMKSTSYPKSTRKTSITTNQQDSSVKQTSKAQENGKETTEIVITKQNKPNTTKKTTTSTMSKTTIIIIVCCVSFLVILIITSLIFFAKYRKAKTNYGIMKDDKSNISAKRFDVLNSQISHTTNNNGNMYANGLSNPVFDGHLEELHPNVGSTKV